MAHSTRHHKNDKFSDLNGEFRKRSARKLCLCPFYQIGISTLCGSPTNNDFRFNTLSPCRISILQIHRARKKPRRKHPSWNINRNVIKMKRRKSRKKMKNDAEKWSTKNSTGWQHSSWQLFSLDNLLNSEDCLASTKERKNEKKNTQNGEGHLVNTLFSPLTHRKHNGLSLRMSNIYGHFGWIKWSLILDPFSVEHDEMALLF